MHWSNTVDNSCQYLFTARLYACTTVRWWGKTDRKQLFPADHRQKLLSCSWKYCVGGGDRAGIILELRSYEPSLSSRLTLQLSTSPAPAHAEAA